MKPYHLDLFPGITEFEFEGNPYDGKNNNTFESYDACKIIEFANAFKTANPTKPLLEATIDFWDSINRQCVSDLTGIPVEDIGMPPEEIVNKQIDSGDQQGAPSVPEGLGGRGRSNLAERINPSPDDEPTRPPEGEPHPTHSDEKPQAQTTAGDPVDIFNGAFYLEETDLEIPNTIMPLVFRRFYRSGAAAYGPLGWNWDHNYNLYIRELNNGNIAIWRNLHEDVFVFDGANFEPPRGVFERLSRVPGIAQAFEISGKGGVTMRFERPGGWLDGERIPIIWMRDRHGNQLTYSYGAEDKLTGVTDDDGRFFQFAYDQCGLLVSVADHTGRNYAYEHDEETMQLICVTSPATTDHPKGITKFYHYENPIAFPELRHNILRIEDSDGRVYLENKYEQDPASWSYSRVTEQLYGGFLFQFRYTQLQWVPANPIYINIPAVRVEVMNPDFGLETYTFNYRGDLIDHRWRLNKDKSFRVVIWQYEYDEQGNLETIVKPDLSKEIRIHDFDNSDPRMRGALKIYAKTSSLGTHSRVISTRTYDPNYQLLIKEQNEKNAITHYRYDFDITPAAPTNTGKLKKIIYPDTTLPDGALQSCVVQFEHNAKGQITAIVNPDGTREELVYGNAGNKTNRLITRRIDPGGIHIENHLSYDNFGYLKERIDGNGHSTKSVYNALGQIEQQIEPVINGNEATTLFHYDSDKKLIATEKPKGSYTGIAGSHIIDIYERDVLGYPTKYILSENTHEKRTFTICNDYRGNPTEVNKPDESVIKRIIDERGLLVYEEKRGKDGKIVSSKNVYDRTGRITDVISTDGLRTHYKYDGFGNIRLVKLPNGSTVKRIWGKNDLLLSEEVFQDYKQATQKLLTKTTYEYDEKDRKIKESINSYENNPAMSVDLETQFFYDTMDRLVKVQDFRGAEKTLSYDKAGRLKLEIDPEGNEEHYFYDDNGNISKIESLHIEPSGASTVLSKQYKYDARNRRIQIIEPDGAAYSEQWDDRNLIVGRISLLGISNEIRYNSFGEKVQEIIDSGGLSITHQYSLDNIGRIRVYLDPLGQESKFTFDSLGRLEKIEYPNGFSSKRTYNSNGLINREELSSGVVFEYKYDPANRLKIINNTESPATISGIPVHQFSYDGLDRVIFAKSGTNQVVRTYDSLGRLTSEAMNGHVIRCSYDDMVGFVDKIWSDGRKERYAHNLNGIVVNIIQTDTGSLGVGNGTIAEFVPSGPNNFGVAKYKNNFNIEAAYDERKRLIELTMSNHGTTNETLKYRYDTGNRKRVEAIIGNNSRISLHNFDTKNRLKESKYGLRTPILNALTQAENDNAIGVVQGNSAITVEEESFTYNNSDERLMHAQTGNPDKNYTYLNGHRIQTDGTNIHSFHTDGTLSTDGVFDFEVDSMGRVVRIEKGRNLVLEIQYDAFGRPCILQEDRKPKLSFNYLGNFVEQENYNNVPHMQFTLHPATGVPIKYHYADHSHYSLFDARFNLIGLADENGDILETFRYKSFGSPTVFDSTGRKLSKSNFDIQPIFGGQRFINSCELYLSTRRLMNPINGAYYSQDPMGYADSPSLYVYAGQNPIDNFDPHGEIIPFIVAAFVIGGAVGGTGYSLYDAYHNPNKYKGGKGGLRAFGNVLGGAAIGGSVIVAGEAVLAAGGVGVFASSGSATSLSIGQSFGLYGLSSAASGSIGRLGLNSLAPELVDPLSFGTVTTDFFAGGTFGIIGKGIGSFASRNGPTYTLQGNAIDILRSERIWGMTEGGIYGMANNSFGRIRDYIRATGGGVQGGRLGDAAIFEIPGTANLFRPHEGIGPFSLLKRILGQRKAGFGDIVFDSVEQLASQTIKGIEVPAYRLIGAKLLEGNFKGQSASWAASRLWGRRALDATLMTGMTLGVSDRTRDLISSNQTGKSEGGK